MKLQGVEILRISDFRRFFTIEEFILNKEAFSHLFSYIDVNLFCDTTEECAEHYIHRDKQEKRCKCAPQYAKSRALVLLDKVSPYNLYEQEAIVLFFRHMTNSP